jgi:hypothetical protein
VAARQPTEPPMSPNLTRKELYHLVPLPIDWSEQRALLGFDR